MSGEIRIARQISIREAGHDERWLQDMIYDNPACLGLGELDAVAKERPQSSGGRLDILLKDAEDNSMYEVEPDAWRHGRNPHHSDDRVLG